MCSRPFTNSLVIACDWHRVEKALVDYKTGHEARLEDAGKSNDFMIKPQTSWDINTPINANDTGIDKHFKSRIFLLEANFV